MKQLRTSEKFRIYREVGKILRTAHPELFPVRGRRPPLKKGILRELIALHGEKVTATKIRVFLRVWTHSTSYLMSLSRGGSRLGIGAVTCESVMERHMKEAAECVRNRKLKTRPIC
jgi:Activator of osmoprotectant transporter ProP